MSQLPKKWYVGYAQEYDIDAGDDGRTIGYPTGRGPAHASVRPPVDQGPPVMLPIKGIPRLVVTRTVQARRTGRAFQHRPGPPHRGGQAPYPGQEHPKAICHPSHSPHPLFRRPPLPPQHLLPERLAGARG